MPAGFHYLTPARLAPVIAVALMAASLLVASPSRRSTGAPKEPDGPALKLTVTPRNGFRPFNLTLTGHLSGVDPTDERYCHAGVEWESRTPSGLTVTSKEDPKCLHPPEQVQVLMTFTKVVTLSTPGEYVYRLILHRRDGEKLISNTQQVRVLDTQ
jgi:hypothetical protein